MAQLIMTLPLGGAALREAPGAGVRVATGADADAMGRLMGAAFPEMSWDADRVRRELLDAGDVAETFVVADGAQVIATASARYHAGFPGQGYVHWVAVDPARRGQGLFDAVMAAVFKTFAAAGKPAMLETDDVRLPAIAAYLRLGFVPSYRDPDHEMRWSHIFQRLGEARHARRTA
jgi:GNAT superfamily N-acetyltransferase